MELSTVSHGHAIVLAITGRLDSETAPALETRLLDLIAQGHRRIIVDLAGTFSGAGTSLTAGEVTDTLMLCQGERAILETRFRYPGGFMFHAHQSEFAELGWMGMFQAEGARRDT